MAEKEAWLVRLPEPDELETLPRLHHHCHLNTVESFDALRGLSTTALSGNCKQFLRARLVPVGALEEPYEFAGH